MCFSGPILPTMTAALHPGLGGSVADELARLVEVVSAFEVCVGQESGWIFSLEGNGGIIWFDGGGSCIGAGNECGCREKCSLIKTANEHSPSPPK